jgi:hypothetical protein
LFCAAAAATAVTPLVARAGDPGAWTYGVQTAVNDQSDESNQTAYTGPVSLSTTVPGVGTASGFADLNFGINKASARLQAPNANNPMEAGFAFAYATWGDVMTISHPKHNGEPGSFTATLRVNGNGSFSISPSWEQGGVTLSALWQGAIGVTDMKGNGDPKNFASFEGGWIKDPLINNGQLHYEGAPLNALQDQATFTFVYGEPFVLVGALTTEMILDNFLIEPGTLDASIDLSNSAYWGGMSVIRDPFGNVVTDATLTSNSGVHWNVAVDPNSARGDFDDNGTVNLEDFNILAANFGTTVGAWTLGDATGDGRVNLSDFNILAANFGVTAGATGGGVTPGDWAALSAGVPEPASTGALGVVACAALVRRRRHARA